MASVGSRFVPLGASRNGPPPSSFTSTSSMTIAQREGILAALRTLGEQEQIVEEARKELCSLPSFEPFGAFLKLQGGPTRQRGWLVPDDFTKALQAAGPLPPSFLPLDAALRPYQNSAGELRYDAFLLLTLPRHPDNQTLKRTTLLRGSSSGSSDPFKPDVLQKLVALIAAEQDLQGLTSHHARHLRALLGPPPSLGLLLRFIDSTEGSCAAMGGVVAAANIRRLLVGQTQALSPDVCDALIRRLNPSDKVLIPASDLLEALGLSEEPRPPQSTPPRPSPPTNYPINHFFPSFGPPPLPSLSGPPSPGLGGGGGLSSKFALTSASASLSMASTMLPPGGLEPSPRSLAPSPATIRAEGPCGIGGFGDDSCTFNLTHGSRSECGRGGGGGQTSFTFGDQPGIANSPGMQPLSARASQLRTFSSPRLSPGSPATYSSLAAAARSAKRSPSSGRSAEVRGRSPTPSPSPSPSPWPSPVPNMSASVTQFSLVPRSPFGQKRQQEQQEQQDQQEQQEQQQQQRQEAPLLRASRSSRFMAVDQTNRDASRTNLGANFSYSAIFAPYFDHTTPHLHATTAQSTLLTVARHVALSHQIQEEARRLRYEMPIEEIFKCWDRHQKGFATYTDLIIFSQEHDPLQEVSNLSGIRCLVAEAHKVVQGSRVPAPTTGQLTFQELALLLVPFGGQEFEALLGASSDQEARSVLYILRSSEPCPKCRHRIQRSGDCTGCPIVTCPICDHAFRCVTVVSDENPMRAVRTPAEVGRKLRFGIHVGAADGARETEARFQDQVQDPDQRGGNLAGTTTMTMTTRRTGMAAAPASAPPFKSTHPAVACSRSCGSLGPFRTQIARVPCLFDFLAASSKCAEALESIRRGLWGKDLWTCFSLLSQGQASIDSIEALSQGCARAGVRLGREELALLWQGVTRHAGTSKLYQSRCMEFEAFVRYLQPATRA